MKKILTCAAIISMVLSLTACGPQGDALVSGDSLSTLAPEASADPESVTVPEPEITSESETQPTEPSAAESSESNTAPASSESATSAADATTKATTTKATSETTAKTAEAAASKTEATSAEETEPAADDNPEQLDDDQEWEDIPDLDKFFADLGLEPGGEEDGDDFSVND